MDMCYSSQTTQESYHLGVPARLAVDVLLACLGVGRQEVPGGGGY